MPSVWTIVKKTFCLLYKKKIKKKEGENIVGEAKQLETHWNIYMYIFKGRAVCVWL